MLYNRKLEEEVLSIKNMDLISTEFKASIYDEIANYLSDNGCTEGMNLVNNIKQQMNDYANSLSKDLHEIEDVFAEICGLFQRVKCEKQDMPKIFTINNREVFINYINEKYVFIYYIGFDDYKKLYKYGIIQSNVNGRKLFKLNSKIGFSKEPDLNKYLDFKVCFNELLHRLGEAKSVEALNSVMQNIKNELSELFYVKDIDKFLIKKSKEIKESIGISGIDIYSELKERYDINKIKIKLTLIGCSVENDKIIELIGLELSRISLLKEIDRLDDDKGLKHIYTCEVEEENYRIDTLLRELNMSLDDLEKLLRKINS